MTTDHNSILETFRERGALLEGHFLLTSGLHSPVYLQCARVLEDTRIAEELGRSLAGAARDQGIEAVISPAIGGIVIGQETARGLGVRSIFAERSEGRMTLRRGFEISPGERFLVVEDVLTTGGSLREVIDLVRSRGGVAAAAAAIVSRKPSLELGVPLVTLVEVTAEAYHPEECPICREGGPAPVKPGSRGNK